MKTPADMVEGTIHKTKKCGNLKIVKYHNSRLATISFLNTGYTRYANPHIIRKGETKDPYHPSVFGIGFMGEGKHRSTIRGKRTKTYSLWIGILNRCYSGRYPSYKDCSVDPRWHNYQNFANDLPTLKGYEQYLSHLSIGSRNPIELDKDTLISGNKLYSKETCCFISGSENMIESNKRRNAVH
ncbi:hypothetical protein RA178_06185 [Shewanella oncorhynchi]|uniref:Uncharacterized protein n=1 Tax=Shewanella oncorhynchi TaxID=2726434 RepID=A0AA50Q7V8_9GAMM|nr:hypothetical protein [Shewanella oncorhynchi]WMB74200.1 hypothetical protein RA178_06185 [Shewanella oncorhynchi]